MKLLVLSRYSHLGASSRLRMLQYIPALSSADFDMDIVPFFDDSYLESLYAGELSGFATAGYFIGRLQKLLVAKKPDLVWVEKEAFPWLPWPIERAILPRNIPIVSDYDDAVFHRYDRHKNAAVKLFLGRKIDGVMAHSDLVVAGNQYLADRAIAAGAQRVEIVPTVVDMEAYSIEHLPSDDDCARIGWIGSPSTWKEYMVPMLSLLLSVATKQDAIIRAVGADHTAQSSSKLELLLWSEKTEITTIQGMDIGIMPLDDSPWARGKCGYKLIQYMACGLPVIASPVGVNSEIVEHGVNGFLVQTEEEWTNALKTLLTNPELRKRMGTAGRKKVEQEYSLQIYGPKVAGLLHEVALSGRASKR